MKRLRPVSRAQRSIAATLALVALAGCVGISYQEPGQPIVPHAGNTLVSGRLRFFHDGREFFPWKADVAVFPVANTERHVWLLRLGQRAVSAELHPDQDGSLAIWLATGDYALVGSTEAMGAGTAAFDVVAFFRVPAATAAMYAGDLIFRTESHEGGHWSYGEFGKVSIDMPPVELARATLEQKFGVLPERFVLSPWCASDHLPGFNNPELATRAREILDRGCPAA
ncbi:MAG TPA: hypothetical protein VIB01_00640 [Steroidobacteraceae bacterium]